MNEGSKVTISIILLGTALVLLVYGALEVSFINNSSSSNGFASLVTIELVIAGALLLPLGWVGLYRSTDGKQRLAAQGGGLLLGGIIFGGGLYWEAVTTSGVNFLTLYSATPVIFAGLALVAITVNSFLTAASGSLGPYAASQVVDSRTPSATAQIPSDSAFCPFCGSPIAGDHKFCRKCGEPISQ